MADDTERTNLRSALKQVREYCKSLEESLRGSDDPDAIAALESADEPED